MNIIITLLIAAAVAWVLLWLIDMVGLPHPINVIAKGAIVVLAILYILRATGFG